MKSLLVLLLLGFATLFTFTSCEDDTTKEPLTGPSITLSSPSVEEGMRGFSKGETIHVKGLIVDNEGIDQVRLHIINQHNEDLDPDDDADNLIYEEYIIDQEISIPETARIGEYRLMILATDYDGNTNKYEAQIRIL